MAEADRFSCEPLLSFAWFLSAPLSLSAFGLLLQADIARHVQHFAVPIRDLLGLSDEKEGLPRLSGQTKP